MGSNANKINGTLLSVFCKSLYLEVPTNLQLLGHPTKVFTRLLKRVLLIVLL